MKIATFYRIVNDCYLKPSLRNKYWDISKLATELQFIAANPELGLRKPLLNDIRQYYLNTVQPVQGQNAERLHAAVEWLMYAQSTSADEGVSLGYFPCARTHNGWHPSYPETTGYIITSLLEYARRFDYSKAREVAINMAWWEVDVQMPSGAVQGGPVTTQDKQTPAAFNTGMVLDGLCSAYQETQDVGLLDAARKAADFLVHDLDEDGYFKTNGHYVSKGEVKTYTCLCAWALYRFGNLVDNGIYREAAVLSIEAALRQQQDNGWFAHNCLSHSNSPLTHTIGYALQGILEVGFLAGREDFIAAARKGVEPLLKAISPTGYLAGRFYADWEPAAFYSCLTGSAQIAVVAFRLAEYTGSSLYAESANRLVDFLKALQTIDSPNVAINGALAGSFPLSGGYMRNGYPNWATKYFIDALLLQDRWRHTA